MVWHDEQLLNPAPQPAAMSKAVLLEDVYRMQGPKHAVGGEGWQCTIVVSIIQPMNQPVISLCVIGLENEVKKD